MHLRAARVGNVDNRNVVRHGVSLALVMKLSVDGEVRLQHLIGPEIQIVATVGWRVENTLAAHGDRNHRILSNPPQWNAVEPDAGYVALSYACLTCDFYQMARAERIPTAQQRRT